MGFMVSVGSDGYGKGRGGWFSSTSVVLAEVIPPRVWLVPNAALRGEESADPRPRPNLASRGLRAPLSSPRFNRALIRAGSGIRGAVTAVFGAT